MYTYPVSPKLVMSTLSSPCAAKRAATSEGIVHASRWKSPNMVDPPKKKMRRPPVLTGAACTVRRCPRLSTLMYLPRRGRRRQYTYDTHRSRKLASSSVRNSAYQDESAYGLRGRVAWPRRRAASRRKAPSAR